MFFYLQLEGDVIDSKTCQKLWGKEGTVIDSQLCFGSSSQGTYLPALFEALMSVQIKRKLPTDVDEMVIFDDLSRSCPINYLQNLSF